MRFIGGVMDGKELEVEDGFMTLHVPVKDGEWDNPLNSVVMGYQIYERRGEEMVWIKTIGG